MSCILDKNIDEDFDEDLHNILEEIKQKALEEEEYTLHSCKD